MWRFLRILLVLLTLSTLPSGPAGAQDPTDGALARVRARGEILLAVDPTSPPFETKEGDTLRGFDIDLGNALAQQLGVRAHWVPMDWSGVFSALATGKVDVVMSGVTITDERKKEIAFTRSYFLSGQALVRRRGDASVTGPESLISGGKTVAVQQETTGQFSIEKKGMPKDRIHRFNTLQDGLFDVRNGRSDAAVADLPTLRETLRTGYSELELVPGGVFVSEYIGIAVRPADRSLVAALNIALDRAFVEGSYARAYQKWVGETPEVDLLGRLAAAKDTGTAIPASITADAKKLLAGTASAQNASSDAPPVAATAFTIRGDLLARALPLLLRGALLTLELTVLTLILGIPLGLLIALGRLSGVLPLRWFATAYVEALRGTPLLAQIYVVYYILPALHIYLTPFTAGLTALSLNAGAYIAEIFRAGIESIDSGQREAAFALGMSGPQAMRYVILPQTVRRVLPPLTNEAAALLKDSSLVSVVSLSELMRVGQEVVTSSGSPTTIYLAVALIYLAMTLPLTWTVRRLESRWQFVRRVRPTAVP